MCRIWYSGSVRGFARLALPEIRRAAMRGWNLANHSSCIQSLLDSASYRERLKRNSTCLRGRTLVVDNGNTP